jgi:hypothetical protein
VLARGVVALLVVVGTAAPAHADKAADLIAKDPGPYSDDELECAM